jgi:hypothetical protein
MAIVATFSPESNFWKLHSYMIIGVFKELYDKDRSKDKKDSSDIMWFVAYCYEMENNPFYSLPTEEKFSIIGKDFFNDEKYYGNNERKLIPIIEFFCKCQDTQFSRHLRMWDELLDKRSTFLKTQGYDLESFEQLDKMAVGTDKVYATIKKIKEDILKEDKSGSTIKGGTVPSMGDTGEI